MTYRIRTTTGVPRFVAFGAVTLADAFGSAAYDILGPKALAVPAGITSERVADAVVHLEAYKVRPDRRSGLLEPPDDVRVVNLCGEVAVRLRTPVSLLVPTAADVSNSVPAPQDEGQDHYLCYPAKMLTGHHDGTPAAAFPKGVQVDVQDEFQSRRFDLTRVARLCMPVGKSGNPVQLHGSDKGAPFPIAPATIRHPESPLLCYTARLARHRIEQNGCGPANVSDQGVAISPLQTNHEPRIGVWVANQFGASRIDTKRLSRTSTGTATLLCVRSTVTMP